MYNCMFLTVSSLTKKYNRRKEKSQRRGSITWCTRTKQCFHIRLIKHCQKFCNVDWEEKHKEKQKDKKMDRSRGRNQDKSDDVWKNTVVYQFATIDVEYVLEESIVCRCVKKNVWRVREQTKQNYAANWKGVIALRAAQLSYHSALSFPAV